MTVNTWVLIADGGAAEVYEFEPAGRLRTVSDMVFEGPHKRAREIGADRPGRTFAGAGSARRASMEPPTDPERAAKDGFLEAVVEAMEAARAASKFHRLVVVAPPQALGAIREAMPEKLAAAVVAESRHDYTGRNINDIRDHLGTIEGIAQPPK